MKVGDLVQVVCPTQSGKPLKHIILLLTDHGVLCYRDGSGRVFTGQRVGHPHVMDYQVFENKAEIISECR